MKPLEYRFSLNMNDETAQVFCNVRNGDDCSKLIVSLQEDGRAYTFDDDVHAYFLAKKSDGNSLYTECSVENNTIIYEFTEQTAPVSGTVVCQFLLLSGSNRLTTPIFRLEVFDNVSIDPDSPQSLPEYTALIDATQEAIDATDDMRDLIEEIEYKLEHGELKGDKGDKGDQGNPGADGFSPTATVTKSGHTATITITDKNGTTTVPIYDGDANKMDLAPLNPTAQEIEAMSDGQLYGDTVNHKGVIKGGQEFYDTTYINNNYYNKTSVDSKLIKITYNQNHGGPSTSNTNFKRGDMWLDEAGNIWLVSWVSSGIISWKRITSHVTGGMSDPPSSVSIEAGTYPPYEQGDLYFKRDSSRRIDTIFVLLNYTTSGRTCNLEWADLKSLVDLSNYYTKTEIDSMIPTVPTNISAFTNDSGYLTLGTLPIYDGTVI